MGFHWIPLYTLNFPLPLAGGADIILVVRKGNWVIDAGFVLMKIYSSVTWSAQAGFLDTRNVSDPQ